MEQGMIEGNKLIAEFMESNTSWEQRNFPDPFNNPLHWQSWSFHNVQLSTDISTVWQAVVAFIKWYNSTK